MNKARILRYYYDSFVYGHLGSGVSGFRTYGESIMRVTRDKFRTWTNRLPEMAMDRSVVYHPVRIVPIPFCAMRYVNQDISVPRNEAPESGILQMQRKVNTRLSQTKYPFRATYFRSYKLLAVRALRN